MSLGALAAAGNMVASMVNSREDRKAQARENQKQRDWETQMSNTAYQRQVSDLVAAGLNPASVMTGTGASTPTGGNAPLPTSAHNMSEATQIALNFMNETKRVNAETELANSTSAKNASEARSNEINNETRNVENLAKIQLLKNQSTSAKSSAELAEAEKRVQQELRYDMTIADERRKMERMQYITKNPTMNAIYSVGEGIKDFIDILFPKTPKSIGKNYNINQNSSAKYQNIFG